MEDKKYRVKILPLFEDDLDNLSYLDYYIIERNIKTTYRKQAGYYMTERF